MNEHWKRPFIHAPKLVTIFKNAVLARRLATNTQKAYWRWIREYIRFHGMTHPSKLSEKAISAFLRSLAVNQRVAATTKNQALHALIFFVQTSAWKRIEKNRSNSTRKSQNSNCSDSYQHRIFFDFVKDTSTIFACSKMNVFVWP